MRKKWPQFLEELRKTDTIHIFAAAKKSGVEWNYVAAAVKPGQFMSQHLEPAEPYCGVIEFLYLLSENSLASASELGLLRQFMKQKSREGMDSMILTLLKILKRRGLGRKKALRYGWTKAEGLGASPNEEVYYVTGNVFEWRNGQRMNIVRNRAGRIRRIYDTRGRLSRLFGPGAELLGNLERRGLAG